MRDLLGKNFIYKLVAVFLAVVLWFNASDQQNAYSKQVVKVPLEVRNLPASLVVTELPANVEVQVEGAWSVVENVDAQDFSAFVGLESYKAGKHEAPVEVTVPPGVRLVNVTPSTIVVQLASMTSVQLPIVAKVEGGAASGFRILTPVVEPAEAIIRGPETLLKKVQSARVNVTLNNIREDYVKILPVTLDGSSEDESFNISIAPSTAKVFIPVVPEGRGKMVPLEVVLQGKPLEGYTVGRVQVEPEEVEISGPAETVDKIHSVKTHPVDVEGRESSFTENVGLNVPDNIEVAQQVGVDVFVEIKKE